LHIQNESVAIPQRENPIGNSYQTKRQLLASFYPTNKGLSNMGTKRIATDRYEYIKGTCGDIKPRYKGNRLPLNNSDENSGYLVDMYNVEFVV
jgi:hypothetical protein